MEVCNAKRNDTPRQVAIDKLFPDNKKGEFETPLVESISKEIILEYEEFFSNDRESCINHEANGQIIPQ
jgi:hypothetical protein